MPTLQETFDKVLAHARQMKEKSVDTTDGMSRCAYRTPDDNRCFVGVLINDNDYNPNMEGIACQFSPVCDALSDYYTQFGLLSALQRIHDCYEMYKWEDMFKELADKWELEYKPIFFCSCVLARRHNAIGKFYPNSKWIEAENKEAAEQAFRDEFETGGPPVIVKTRYEMLKP